tara:strand:- start:11656 stop:12873 length:1218 start_codon:yes stop_codon:yes gene_type:complete
LDKQTNVSKRKIRVLRIINRFNIGGPTYNATFLTAFLDDRFETKLVGGLPDIGEADSLYILNKYNVKPELIKEMVRLPNIKSDREAFLKLKSIIREFKPDIVHTHASKAGALGRKAAQSCNVPVIVHTFHGHVFHSYFGKLKTTIFKMIERRLAKKSDAIVAISNLQKNELTEIHKICAKEKTRVVPLGFDLQQFNEKKISKRLEERQRLNLTKDEVAIAIVGRLAPIKNHSYFLDVAESVLDKSTVPLKIFIVGDGPEKEKIEERVKIINGKYNNSIILTSWVTDVATFNSAMDVMCLTSLNEGTPVSLIEAQASGIPIVTTDVGGVKDILLEGETGFVVPLDRKNLFVDRLLELINDEKKREKMSQNGWKHVEEKFHYGTLVKNMTNLYLELLELKKNEIKFQ